MVEHTYECENIVVGATLESLVLANFLDAVYIQNESRPPFLFDYVHPELDLGFLDLGNESRTLQTNEGSLCVGRSKHDIWEDLLFKSALEGRAPLSAFSPRLRLKEGTIRAIVRKTEQVDFIYDMLYICDDKGIFGMPPPVVEEESYRVYDWYDVNQGCVHQYDTFVTSDALVQRVDFYASPRIDGNDGSRKDLVVTSMVDSKEKLFDIEYSDLYSRFKTVKLMQDHGIRGDNGTPPKIVLNRRDVCEVRTAEYEFEEENIKYVGSSLGGIMEGTFDW